MEYERFEFPQPMYGDVNVLRIGDTLVDIGHVASRCRNEVIGALDGPLAGFETLESMWDIYYRGLLDVQVMDDIRSS